MAYCPKCNAEMAATEAVCPACGHDFPPESPRKGLTYSVWADIALMIGCVTAVFGCIGAVIAGVFAALAGEYLHAFVTAPVTFFHCLAMAVVFQRIQNV